MPTASLQRGKAPHHHDECPGYGIKQSDGETSEMLEPWGMRSNPSLPSLPGVVTPDNVLSMSQIELIDI